MKTYTAPSRQARVLVVDGEASIRKRLSKIFTLAEHEVDTAVDGESALEQLRARPYDLLVTELKLPRMHGLGLIREAKRLNADLRILIVTDSPTKGSATEAAKIGVSAYLTKPFRAPRVLDAAADALGPSLPSSLASLEHEKLGTVRKIPRRTIWNRYFLGISIGGTVVLLGVSVVAAALGDEGNALNFLMFAAISGFMAGAAWFDPPREGDPEPAKPPLLRWVEEQAMKPARRRRMMLTIGIFLIAVSIFPGFDFRGRYSWSGDSRLAMGIGAVLVVLAFVTKKEGESF